MWNAKLKGLDYSSKIKVIAGAYPNIDEGIIASHDLPLAFFPRVVHYTT